MSVVWPIVFCSLAALVALTLMLLHWYRSGEISRNLRSIAHDVSELKNLEAELYQSQKMETVGRLAGGIAHDFNNLLTIIQGNNSLILERLEPGGELARYSQEVKQASERAASLTQQLLAFSRKQVMIPRAMSLNRTVTAVERMLHRLIGEDIRLQVDLDPDLGSVHADPSQIELVLLNLAVNSRDALPQGGRLRISTQGVDLSDSSKARPFDLEPGRYALLSFSDDGLGMDEETRSHAFEPFFTTKEEGKGTGLGLSTVYGIVKQSGGGVTVDSRPGEGTRFRIYLPIALDPVEPNEDRPSKTVLVVDSDQGARASSLSSRAKAPIRPLEHGFSGPASAKRPGFLTDESLNPPPPIRNR